MGRSYPPNPATLKPATVSEPVFTAIGRLVRAMAEIEDMVDLFICGLANISEPTAFILLGRTAVTRRVEIAEALAAIQSDSALKAHKLAFDALYTDLVNCRNAVAHGALLGEDDNGRLYFQSSNQLTPADQQVRRIVNSYSPEQIIECARLARKSLPRFEQLLQVSDLREARLQQAIQPHPKAQGGQSAKPQPQPQPSRG